MNTEQHTRDGFASVSPRLPSAAAANGGPVFGRRGNALIMAVTLTAMLAIIGSSFVLVTRLERQTVRSFGNVQGLEEIQEYVIRRIQTTLADGIVTQLAGNNVALDRLNSDGTEARRPPNKRYNPWDAPLYDTGTSVGDPFLAPIEPSGTGAGPFQWPQVSDVLGLDGSGTPAPATNRQARAWNRNGDVRPFNPASPDFDGDGDGVPDGDADADGDGITDSIWRRIQTAQQRGDGKDVLVALRIIDNCGMLNLNTAWDARPAVPVDLDSYGLLPTQLDVLALLKAAKPNWDSTVDTQRSVQWPRLSLSANAQPGTSYGDYTTPDGLSGLNRNYADWVLRFYEAPTTFAWNITRSPPYTDPNAPYDLGRYARLFDVRDEVALRYRFLLKSDATARVEDLYYAPSFAKLGLWNVIGDGPGEPFTDANRNGQWDSGESYTDKDGNGKYTDQKRQRLPYTDVTTWAESLLGTETDPTRDIRHLLTAYSFDRTVRPRDYDTRSYPPSGPPDPKGLDLPTVLGRFRLMDIPTAVQWLLAYNPPAPFAATDFHCQAALKLIYAVAGALKQPGQDPTPAQFDQAVQYVANLRDYLDDDSILTTYGPGYFGKVNSIDVPSRSIFGFEQQPFISEVVVRAKTPTGTSSPTVDFCAIELCNPYAKAINLATFGYRLTGAALVTSPLSLGSLIVPPAVYDGDPPKWRPGRLIIVNKAVMPDPTDVTTESQGLPNPAVQLVPTLSFKAQIKEPLKLVRSSGGGSPTEVLVDYVPDGSMEDVTAKNAPGDGNTQEYSLQRGVGRWRFARAEFDFAASGDFLPPANPPIPRSGLGRWYAKSHPVDGLGGANDLTKPPGTVLAVADRGPLLVPAGNGSATVPRWLVQGWFDMTRPTFLGNPQDGASTDTVTAAVNSRITAAPTLDEVNLAEQHVRIDLTAVRPSPPSSTDYMTSAQRLFESMGFFSRCDDGYANEAGEWMPPLWAPPGTHIPERLSECRIPGRINLNTAPAAVLEAALPSLPDQVDILPAVSGADWADYQKTMRSWFAQVVIHLRDPAYGGTPFTSMSDFLQRLDRFDNSSRLLPLGSPKVASHTFATVPHIMRYGRLLAYVEYNRTTNASLPLRLRDVGDRSMRSDLGQADLESRDWLFGRLANLLTVRSDTFTAYILIRLQNPNNTSEHSDRRLIALLDRSNVFLPPALAQTTNTNNDSRDPMPTGLPTDPNYWDRQYTTPKVVAIQQVGDAN